MADVRRALVVEDNPAVLLEAVGILEDIGYDVTSTFDADTAMRWLGDHVSGLSLLFTNVELPGRCSGFAIARWARQHMVELPIVVASGRLAPAPGDMPVGGLFLSKPYSAEMLVEAVRDAEAGARIVAKAG